MLQISIEYCKIFAWKMLNVNPALYVLSEHIIFCEKHGVCYQVITYHTFNNKAHGLTDEYY